MDERLKQVEELIAHGKKVRAIQLYREIRGKGLKESKEDVEYFMAHQRWENDTSIQQEIDTGGDSELAVVEALATPRTKIKAIKAYREVTGKGLKEAKDDVEYFMTHQVWKNAQPTQYLETSSAEESGESVAEPIIAIEVPPSIHEFPEAQQVLIQSLEEPLHLLAAVAATFNLEKGVLFLSQAWAAYAA